MVTLTKRQQRRAELTAMRATPKGPTKGIEACNREACQALIKPGHRWWNSETRAWYCTSCARRINEACRQSGINEICALNG